MYKYIIAQKFRDGSNTILEAVTCKNEKEARKYATRKYLNIVVSGTSQLIVITERGYNQHYA